MRRLCHVDDETGFEGQLLGSGCDEYVGRRAFVGHDEDESRLHLPRVVRASRAQAMLAQVNMCQVGPADDGATHRRLLHICIERCVAPLEGLCRICSEPACIDEKFPSPYRAGQTEVERIISSSPCLRTSG